MKYEKDKYVKSNDLVQATVNNLTVAQNRLMVMLLTEYVNNYDENSIEDTITLSRYDIINYLGLSDSGQTYKNMNNTIRSFFQNSIVTWIDQERNSEKTTALFSEVEIRDYNKDGDSQVTFTWNNKIKPHLTGMSKKYTTLVTANFLALKSKRSQVLYEFFNSCVNLENGFITVPIDKLKEITGCTSPAYKVFKDFFKRGITLPLEEINDKTDIKVEVISKNKGNVNKRVIVSITFRVTNQQAKKMWFEQYPEILLTEDEYRKVTQEFYIDNFFIGKQLVNKLAETKRKKPNTIHNDFKQLEKYYKAEVKKHEKLYAEESTGDKTGAINEEFEQLLANLQKGE